MTNPTRCPSSSDDPAFPIVARSESIPIRNSQNFDTAIVVPAFATLHVQHLDGHIGARFAALTFGKYLICLR